jgi:hypothetical protein
MSVTDIVKNIETAAAQLADATVAEMQLEDHRITVKLAAIDRIMHSGDNPLTGKPHSFSSAEAIVNTDEEYQNYLARVRDAVRQRVLARGNYDASLATARLKEGANV